MFFYLLMQPNTIETVHRKVCMRINEDYYIENVYTLIRVPNNSITSQEFALRYFCLQSDSTHNVYIVWKRRNRVKRIDKTPVDGRSASSSRSHTKKQEIVSHNSNRSSNRTYFIRQTTKLLIKSKLLKSFLLNKSSVRRDSLESLNRLSNGLSTDSMSNVVLMNLKSKTNKIPFNRSITKFSFSTTKPKSFASFRIVSFRKCALSSIHKLKDRSNRTKSLSDTKLKLKKFNKNLRKGKLFKLLKNKLKTFNFNKIHDSSSDPFQESSAKVLISLDETNRNETIYSTTNRIGNCSTRVRPQVANESIVIDANENDLNDRFIDRSVNKRKNLFSNLLNRFASKTNRLTKSSTSTKSSPVDKAKKRIKSVFKDIRHSFVKFMASKSD